MKHTFYAVRFIPEDIACEIEGGVCYDSYASKKEAQKSADNGNKSYRKYHGATVDMYDVIVLPDNLKPSPSALLKLAGITDDELDTVGNRMITDKLDYFNISGHWHLLAEDDGIWLMFGDEKLYRAWSITWRVPGVERAELQADFIRLAKLTATPDFQYRAYEVGNTAARASNEDLQGYIVRMNLKRAGLAPDLFGGSNEC